MGLSYPDALHYFTDLAQIRDETMAYWIARGLAERAPHLMVVAGDWHVQTSLAVPDRVARLAPSKKILTITTAPSNRLAEIRDFTYADRKVADYVITYAAPTPPPPPPPAQSALSAGRYPGPSARAGRCRRARARRRRPACALCARGRARSRGRSPSTRGS